MRNIVDCVNAFLPLLNTEYELVLGRKGVAVELHLFFDKKDCFHLMGLQYLDDRPELNRDRGKIFDEIVAGKITTEHLETENFVVRDLKADDKEYIKELEELRPWVKGILKTVVTSELCTRKTCKGDFPFLYEYKVEKFCIAKEQTELNKIEIRCRNGRCNRLFMNYYVTGNNVDLNLEGFELKCEKCKRVLRLKNYTEALLIKHSENGVFKV